MTTLSTAVPVHGSLPRTGSRLALVLAAALLASAGCRSMDDAEPPRAAASGPECERDPQATDASDPPCGRPTTSTSRVPYEARGHEPGWFLRITAERVHLTYAYGTRQLDGPRPEPVTLSGGYLYTITAEEHDLRIRVRDRPCVAASGKQYPDTVTIRIDGETFTGCGGTIGTPAG